MLSDYDRTNFANNQQNVDQVNRAYDKKDDSNNSDHMDDKVVHDDELINEIRIKKQKKKKKHDTNHKAKVTKVPIVAATPTTQNQNGDRHNNKKINNYSELTAKTDDRTSSSLYPLEPGARQLVESSALPDTKIQQHDDNNNITLVLFYQYVEPTWNDKTYQSILKHMDIMGKQYSISGRMRIAPEGFNCTLTSTKENIYHFIQYLRKWKPQHFYQTEFKCTHDLPALQRFPLLKIIPVKELVRYGLDGSKAPSLLQYSGVHLEPIEYHKKLSEPDTVIIDVRNHYEAIIGRFDPPTIPISSTDEHESKNDHNKKQTHKGWDNVHHSDNNSDDRTVTTNSTNRNQNSEKWLDPKMRKSTEFPMWLNDPSTKEKLRNKQILMYCTGGIRCERASALLQYKMQHDETMQDLNVQGVYQLQGGIDKYFKEFPDGGYWKGKNYVFDKRFAHVPVDNIEDKTKGKDKEQSIQPKHNDDISLSSSYHEPLNKEENKQKQENDNKNKPMSYCEACKKPWDMYRGKRRCPTCGVPSLICKDCYQLDYDGVRKLDYTIRCDLCIEQNIFSKKQLNNKIQHDMQQYENQCKQKGILEPSSVQQQKAKHMNNTNPLNITRLYLRNMCQKNMTHEVLMEQFPGITHIVWKLRHGGEFTGQGWVEMISPQAASDFVARSGEVILGRPIYVEYQPPNPKDIWPPPHHAVV